MQREFNFDKIKSVEFCVSVRAKKGMETNYFVPTDSTVQDALRDVLDATVEAIAPDEEGWAPYELSEKYASKESLQAALAEESMASVKALHEEEGWPTHTGALQDPKSIAYYFGVFRDDKKRRLTAVRRATQFKGTVKGRFLSLVDDTLRMVADRVFKLDEVFDFLITAQNVYILHPAGFEQVAAIESFAAARAHEKALALGAKVPFIDFAGLADYVAKHKRGARLVAALDGRGDLSSIDRAAFCKAAKETGVELKKSGAKLVPERGSEIGCLEMLDDRRYTTSFRKGPKPAFIAGSRRRVGQAS